MRSILGGSLTGVGLAVAGSILIAASSGYGAEIDRVDWTPGGGLIGDLWKFRCPAGGSVSASVDTVGDISVGGGDFVSALDPELGIFDGRGDLLAAADDEVDCSVPTQCGAGCPAVVKINCGRGAIHSILVRDAGLLPECTGGGTYLLVIEVFDRDGTSLGPLAVKLGGGPRRTLPPWLLRTGLIGAQGPVVDNGSALVNAPGTARLASLRQRTSK